MTTVDQLERDLTAWFGATAARDTPEFAQDVLMATSRVRQRPRWSFVPPLPRPMDRARLLHPIGSTLPRQLIILVVLGAVLALVASAVFVSSRPRLPAPFGPAANGLVAYSRDGDIFVVDPATGQRTGLVVGPEVDEIPRWSLDGTRLAFMRQTEGGRRLVIVDQTGTLQTIARGDALFEVDPDGIRWSPDGRTVLVLAQSRGQGSVYLFDTWSGAQTVLPIAPWGLEVFWRPPDGREVVFLGGLVQQPALYRYSLEDGVITEVPGTGRAPAGGMNEARPIGFTPDGSRFAYHRTAPTPIGFATMVVDIETGASVVLDMAFGRISNDGTRIVGMTSDGTNQWICIAPVDGGPCERIHGSVGLVDWTGWASFQWSPDDRWIWSHQDTDGAALLLDPNGGGPRWPSWASAGVGTWQRRVP